MTLYRPVWAEVALDAVRANVEALRAAAAPAALLAVVKADGYGHGAVAVAQAALAAGAERLGVALVEEGAALRQAGVDAPVLVLSEPVPDAASAVVQHRLTPVVYTAGGIEAIGSAAARAGTVVAVHLKVDTGMGRVGCTPGEAVELATKVAHRAGLLFEGVCTHLAVAEERDHPATSEQLSRFDSVLHDLEVAGLRPPLAHAANTAGIAIPAARYDLVRAGIGIYGIAPTPAAPPPARLSPALSVKARVTHCKCLRAGDRISYGLHYELREDAHVATVPIGYADGVPRSLGRAGGAVLVRGKRCPVAGTVTMDQLMVDCGDLAAEPGDEVVLIGRQGAQEITVYEWADLVGTIPYEIVCGIGGRVPRRYVDADRAAGAEVSGARHVAGSAARSGLATP